MTAKAVCSPMPARGASRQRLTPPRKETAGQKKKGGRGANIAQRVFHPVGNLQNGADAKVEAPLVGMTCRSRNARGCAFIDASVMRRIVSGKHRVADVMIRRKKRADMILRGGSRGQVNSRAPIL